MDDLTKSVDKLNETLNIFIEESKLVSKLLKKYDNNMDMVSIMLQKKSIEDGIIIAFGNASVEQLKNLILHQIFKYYDVEYINKLIEQAIRKRIRKDKINKIEKKESF